MTTPKIVVILCVCFSFFIMPMIWQHDKSIDKALSIIEYHNDTNFKQISNWGDQKIKYQVAKWNSREEQQIERVNDSINEIYSRFIVLVMQKNAKIIHENALSLNDIDSINLLHTQIKRKIIDNLARTYNENFISYIKNDTTIFRYNNELTTKENVLLLTYFKRKVRDRVSNLHNYSVREVSGGIRCYFGNDFGPTIKIKNFDLRTKQRLNGEVLLCHFIKSQIARTQIWVNDSLLYKSTYRFTPQRTGTHTFHVKALVQTKDSTITLRDTFSVYVDK